MSNLMTLEEWKLAQQVEKFFENIPLLLCRLRVTSAETAREEESINDAIVRSKPGHGCASCGE